MISLALIMRKSLNFEVTKESEELRKLLMSSNAPLQEARHQALYQFMTFRCHYRKGIAEKIGYGTFRLVAYI